MSVAFLPYGQPRKHLCDLGQISFEDVEWPLEGRPAGSHLKDLKATDHLIVVASSRALTLQKMQLHGNMKSTAEAVSFEACHFSS